MVKIGLSRIRARIRAAGSRRGTLNPTDAGDYQSIRCSSLILERKAKRIVAIPRISSV
ncbi:MAG TPA: hypothetical protein VK186_18805 [Candidatus Deferrimicrobium sp.]|nr:hypothetical protein [Candidatus Deferrimicrobium sp.]